MSQMGSLKLSFISISMLLIVASPLAFATNEDSCGKIADYNELFEGYTYSQHAVNWLEWVQSMVATESTHPLYEKTGDLCTLNNPLPGNVLMAGGTFGSFQLPSGQVQALTRECRVPLKELTGGKPINGVFFPIVNVVGNENADMLTGVFSKDDKLLTLFQRSKNFFLPCGEICMNKCTNPELKEVGAEAAVTNIKLKVNGKDMTEKVLKVPQTLTSWTPIYNIEGGVSEDIGDIDFNKDCNPRKNPRAKTQCFPGLFTADDDNETRTNKHDDDDSDYNIYRDNAYTYGYYVMLDISECEQHPGSTFKFSFSADFVEPDNTDNILFGFKEIEYKIKFEE